MIFQQKKISYKKNERIMQLIKTRKNHNFKNEVRSIKREARLVEALCEIERE